MCESFVVVVVLSCHFSSDLRCLLQESEGGLYVCMNTFLGFGREHVERHYRKTGQSVYMHLKRHVKEVSLTPVQGLFRKGSLPQQICFSKAALCLLQHFRCVRHVSMDPWKKISFYEPYFRHSNSTNGQICLNIPASHACM